MKTSMQQFMTRLIETEQHRQQHTINLIASENYPSEAVRAPLSSVLSTKYAEGYPGARYYAGCAVVDAIETAAQQALLALFMPDESVRAQYRAHVQPHSGSLANLAVYQAVLKPGDTILSMSLNTGGHLSHGHAAHLVGKMYTIVSYGVDRETECISYEEVRKIAQACRPRLIIAGTSSYPRSIDFKAFKAIAESVGALLLADIAHSAGLIAADAHPSPFGIADVITSTTHKTLRGPRGAFIISKKELSTAIDRSIMPGLQGGPFMHVIAAQAIAYAEAKEPAFISYMHTVKATTALLAATLAATGYHLVSGGTDTHLLVINLAKSAHSETLTGQEAERRLEEMGIIINRNVVPFETRSARHTSGIRIGLAAMVTRGLTEKDIPELARLIHEALHAPSPALRQQVHAFAARFILPGAEKSAE